MMSPIATGTYQAKEIIELVSPPMCDRLMQFVNGAPENRRLYDWNDEHSTVVKAIRKAQKKIEHFKDHRGFTKQAGNVMSAEVVRAFDRFNGQASFYLTGMSYYVEVRRAVILAAEEAHQLSPTLLDPMTEAMRDVATVTVPVASNFGLPGQFMDSLVVTGAACVNAVEAQADAQWEAKSAEIIEHLESTMNSLSSKLQGHTDTRPNLSDRGDWTPIPEIPKDSVDALEKGHITISPYEGGTYRRSHSDAFGNADLRDSDPGLCPEGHDNGEDINQCAIQSPRVPSRYFPEEGVGSRANPITDPRDLMDMDLLYMRVNGDRHTDGVIGGYIPTLPINRDHLLWGLNTSRAAGPQTADRLGDIDVVGTGVLGLRGVAHMGSVSMGAVRRMGGVEVGSFDTPSAGALGHNSVVAGSSALRAGTYGGTDMDTYTPPGSGRSAETAAGQGIAAGQRGGFMGASGTDAGDAKEDKKQHRRKYETFHIEDRDDDALPHGYVNPLSQACDTDKGIASAHRRGDGWNPSQW